jgi:hypothetical protein
MLIVDLRHWLDQNGDLPQDNLRLRRLALRVARFVEYGGPLNPGEGRETLVECSKRPRGKPCLGPLWVYKEDDGAIHATCPVCRRDETVVHGWEDTDWAEGPMPPVSLDDVTAPVH